MEKLSYKLLMSGLGILAVYHVLVLVGGVGFENVWGGKVTDVSTLIALEILALGIVIFSMVVVWQSVVGNHRLWVRIGIWMVSVLFFFSAFANLFAENLIEKIISVPLAFGIGVLALRLALESAKMSKKDLS